MNPRWKHRPAGSTWGDFGPDDQIGRLNLLTPEKVKQGCRVAADLMPVSRYRPITPVGQLLWNWHVSAMEDACYGRKSAQAALDCVPRSAWRRPGLRPLA